MLEKILNMSFKNYVSKVMIQIYYCNQLFLVSTLLIVDINAANALFNIFLGLCFVFFIQIYLIEIPKLMHVYKHSQFSVFSFLYFFLHIIDVRMMFVT